MTAATLQPAAPPGTISGLRSAWRIFWYGGLMSYGMLFNWARPSIYIPTLIGGPTFQLFFFAALGSYATDRSPAYFAIGNAIQVSCLAGVFGMTMAIANERWFGTLPALLATPANRAAVFAGRFLPFIFNGLLVSLYALGIGIVFLGVRLDTSTLAVVGLALLTTVFSCTAIGALHHAVGGDEFGRQSRPVVGFAVNAQRCRHAGDFGDFRPAAHGEFRVVVYRTGHAGGAGASAVGLADEEHVAMVMGDVTGPAVLARVHSSCFTGEVLGSLRCDCRAQLDGALARIAREGRGVLVYLVQEGRGIGLGNKVRAYQLQDDGHDTVDANVALGLPVDSREYGIGAQILVDRGITTMRLMTNNPAKYGGLGGYNLEIVERVPLTSTPNPENDRYLRAKKEKLGHLLDFEDPAPSLPRGGGGFPDAIG